MVAGDANAAVVGLVAACLVATAALMLLVPSEPPHMQRASGLIGSDWDPAMAGEDPVDPETERQIYETLEAVERLRTQNIQLRESPADGSGDARDAVEQNEEAARRLMERLDALSPPMEVVEISEADEAKMNAAMMILMLSGMPVLEMGIDHATGTLGVMIDVDRADRNTEKIIRGIAAGVDVTFTYGKDRATFQSARGQPALH